MDNKFSPPNQLSRCEKSWYFSLLECFHGAFILPLRSLPIHPRNVRHARQALHAGLAAVSTTRRIYLGLALILVAAPLSGAAYQLFDITVIDHSWYYRTYFDFFLILGPYLTICLCLIGTSLLFPQDSVRAYFLLPPLALYVSKILWLCVAESNNDFNAFWQAIPYYFFLTGAIIAFTLIFTFNFLMTLHFHKREGTIARILGILDCPGIEDSERLRIARAEKQNLKSLTKF